MLLYKHPSESDGSKYNSSRLAGINIVEIGSPVLNEEILVEDWKTPSYEYDRSQSAQSNRHVQ